MVNPVYLDNHSTTRMDERVLEAMLPYFTERYGNASSRQHAFGWTAEAAIEKARKQVADMIGCSIGEIVFTSGSTESINLALKGLLEAHTGSRGHVVTVATEHAAVLDTCRRLCDFGFSVTILPVDGKGNVDLDGIVRAITPDTLCVSVMAANNEIGTIAPLASIGAICRAHNVFFHTDATQAIPHVFLNVEKAGIDLLSLSAHKFYGPKGVGALYMKHGVAIEAQIDGGGHQRGSRSGTLDVPGIVGMGEAAALVTAQCAEDAARESELRDLFIEKLEAGVDGVMLHGDLESRLPNNASITFDGVTAERLMMTVGEVAFSSGAACSSGSPGPSHVLRAIGLPADVAQSTVRFGFGRFTTREETLFAADRLVAGVRSLRGRKEQARSSASFGN